MKIQGRNIDWNGESAGGPSEELASDMGEFYVGPCSCANPECRSVTFLMRNPEVSLLTEGPGTGETVYSLNVTLAQVPALLQKIGEISGLGVALVSLRQDGSAPVTPPPPPRVC